MYLENPAVRGMPESLLNVLLIEDNPGDAELVKEALMEVGGAAFRVYCAEALLPGLDRLARGGIDIVLLDLSLPDSHGLEGLNAIRIHAPTLPVVVLTGMDSEALALQAVQTGAQDYLVKGTLEGAALARTLQHAIVRQRAQAATARPAPDPGLGKVVALLGVKGGMGTTTIACHLGMELKRQTGGAVLLMDLDGAANAVAFMLNAKGAYTMLDAASDILRLDRDRWAKLVVPGAGGVDIIQSAGPTCVEEKLPKPDRVRFVVRLVRSFYPYTVIDMGRLSPFSPRIAEEASHPYLVSTCDVHGLNGAKWTANTLCEAGLARDRLALILNQASKLPTLSSREVEKSLGLRVEMVLPECRRDFETAALDGDLLGNSRSFQKSIAQLAARIVGAERKDVPLPKPHFSFLTGAFRGATTAT